MSCSCCIQDGDSGGEAERSRASVGGAGAEAEQSPEGECHVGREKQDASQPSAHLLTYTHGGGVPNTTGIIYGCKQSYVYAGT